MIKAVLFDFVQTLGNAAEGYRKAEKMSQKKLFEKTLGAEWDEFLKVYREVRKAHFERAELSKTGMWMEALSCFKADISSRELEELENRYWDVVNNSMSLFPEALDVLQKLRLRYKTGIVTNSQKEGSTRALDSGVFSELEKVMDVVIIAADGNMPAKPAREPFIAALDRISVKPDEAVFVGDDWRVDIEGSRNAGLTPVWIKHRTVERNWPEPAFKVTEITSLEELLDIEEKIKIQ